MSDPCRICLDRFVGHYSSQLGHEMACSVGSITSPAPASERLYHRAARVERYGGSWDLNVWGAACGATGLGRGFQGRLPCLTCFPNHPELLRIWREESRTQ